MPELIVYQIRLLAFHLNADLLHIQNLTAYNIYNPSEDVFE